MPLPAISECHILCVAALFVIENPLCLALPTNQAYLLKTATGVVLCLDAELTVLHLEPAAL